jgi:hypothetical protein
LIWCTIICWEYNTPFKLQFSVAEKRFQLSQQIFNSFQIKTKNKELLSLITNGLQFDCDNSNITLFNDCGCNCFWICPALNDLSTLNEFNFKPNKIKPKESAIVYNYKLAKKSELKRRKNTMLEVHLINISLNKNWGFNLKRKSIEQCPLWINLSINLEYFS